MALTVAHKETLDLLAREEQAQKATVTKIVEDLKTSEFFRQNWDNLLLAAPNCLELLGNCNAIASTRGAAQVTITPPPNGFKYLAGYTELSGALADVASQGSRSFTTAAIAMTTVNSESMATIDHVKLIVMNLADPQAPMSSVRLRLNALQKSAERCREEAVKIEGTMALWKEFVSELYVACSAQSSKVQTASIDAKSKEQLAEEALEVQKLRETAIEAQCQEMKTQLDDAKEDYKRALNDMPKGIDMVGQQILLGLGQAANSAITIGATAAAAYVSPMSGFSNGAKTLSAEVEKWAPEIKKVAAATGGATTTPSSEPAAGEAASATGDKPTRMAIVKKASLFAKLKAPFVRKAKPEGDAAADPAASTTYDLSGSFSRKDPALSIIASVKVNIDAVKEILVGSPEGIRWEATQPPKDPAKGTATELERLHFNLTRILKSFTPMKGGLASQLTMAVLQEAIAVAKELQAEAAKSSTMGAGARVDRNSPTYEDWDDRISRCASAALKVNELAKSTAGGIVNGQSITAAPPSGNSKIAAINEQTSANQASIAEAALKSATASMKSTQEMYQVRMDYYRDAQDKVMEVKKQLQEARNEVKKYHADHVNLEQVMKILVTTIGYLVELKDRITRLVTFFSGLAVMVKTCVNNYVEPFKGEIEAFAQENQSKAGLYGNYYRDVCFTTSPRSPTTTNLSHTQIIFQMAMQIYSNFSLYTDITSMYLQVHRRCIQPGLILVDNLSIRNLDPEKEEAVFAKKLAELKTFCTDAENTVTDVVKTQQNKIINSLQSRVTALSQSIDRFPLDFRPDQDTVDAIQTGTKLALEEMKEEVAATPSGVLSMFGSTGGVAWE
ncbi:uncharacterized protein BO80DRAFT_434625 [Aspergillus ibericus CBS 121593]|uniref:Uncharacterized protein n=1 Tax=Aspergillus ibericus CBS 121593 TaxID=1448316 RepID=A0A395H3F5_9EURO|nr:hypothetical protein BO80DRAFT_434625 [Aspergillus ibericus CBS 121593]RAL01388.1 hypothetical protein BO80DRAFT_434625 [Aspergillus ibericus CBS 121593]